MARRSTSPIQRIGIASLPKDYAPRRALSQDGRRKKLRSARHAPLPRAILRLEIADDLEAAVAIMEAIEAAGGPTNRAAVGESQGGEGWRGAHLGHHHPTRGQVL